MSKNALFSFVLSWVVVGNCSISTPEQFPLISQNINRFSQFHIGTLSTGEQVLKVPKTEMSSRPFQVALQTPMRPLPQYYSDLFGVFLWDGNALKFVGYDIAAIFDFKVGNKTYWVTRIQANDGSGRLEISQPNFVNSKVVNVNGVDYQFIREFKKDDIQNGVFYVSIASGNGLNIDVITYLIDLRIAVNNPHKNVVVCESSRYQERRNGSSPPIINPNCKI